VAVSFIGGGNRSTVRKPPTKLTTHEFKNLMKISFMSNQRKLECTCTQMENLSQYIFVVDKYYLKEHYGTGTNVNLF
jgi:hypothetical protein